MSPPLSNTVIERVLGMLRRGGGPLEDPVLISLGEMGPRRQNLDFLSSCPTCSADPAGPGKPSVGLGEIPLRIPVSLRRIPLSRRCRAMFCVGFGQNLRAVLCMDIGSPFRVPGDQSTSQCGKKSAMRFHQSSTLSIRAFASINSRWLLLSANSHELSGLRAHVVSRLVSGRCRIPARLDPSGRLLE